MTRCLISALLSTLVINTGCNLIYKQNVQQGNAHIQDDLDQVMLGMSKKQVAFLLGTPAIHDPFHQDRWDYISLLSRRGNEPVRRLITLAFKDDLLISTDGIGDSTGGDIKALEGTKATVATLDDVATVRASELVTDDGVINWTLQLGAFNTRDEALAFTQKIKSKGFVAQLAEYIVPGLGTRHQVRFGLYGTYDEARAVLSGIEEVLDIVGITAPVDRPLNDGP